jgi:hypothetical protein
MKLVGFVGKDINVKQFEALGASVKKYDGVSGNLIFRPYNAYIDFDSYDENRYRPYLHLDGDICGASGFNIGDIDGYVYRDDDKLSRAVRYDFTDDELAILVKKGLYQADFKVPELFTNTDFEIPIVMNLDVVETMDHRIVYADYDMVSDFVINSKTSDYVLAEYFDDQQVDLNVTKQVESNEYDMSEYEIDEPELNNSLNYESGLSGLGKVEHDVEVNNVNVDDTKDVDDLKDSENEHVNVDMIAQNHLSDVEKLERLDIDSILEKSDGVENTDIETVDDSKSNDEPQDNKSEPKIINSQIRNFADELDSGKINNDRLLSGEFGSQESSHDFEMGH